MSDLDLLKIFTEDKKFIAFRPSWAQMTGSILSAILLSEIVFWWKKKNNTPFYKFKEPFQAALKADGFPKVPHPLLKEGDSWCESLSFTRSEFDRALKGIGVRVRKGEKLPENCFVWYWSDMQRLTWYRLNESFFLEKIKEIYVKQDPALRKAESCFSALHNVQQDSAADKNPEGSYHHSPTTTGCGLVVDSSLLCEIPQSDQNKIIKKLEEAPEKQQQVFYELLSAGIDGGSIRNLAPWAKSMAEKAAAGDLTEDTQACRMREIEEARVWSEEIQISLDSGSCLMIGGQKVGSENFPIVSFQKGRTANIYALKRDGVKIEIVESRK